MFGGPAGVDVGAVLLALERGSCWAVLRLFARVLCRIFLLSTISPCAGRHFISFSNGEKETKQRKRLQTLVCR